MQTSSRPTKMNNNSNINRNLMSQSVDVNPMPLAIRQKSFINAG